MSLPLIKLSLRTGSGVEQKFEFRSDSILIGQQGDLVIPEASPSTSYLATVTTGGLRIRQVGSTAAETFILKLRENCTLDGAQLKLDFLAETTLSGFKSQQDTSVQLHEVNELKQQLLKEKHDWESEAERQAEALAVKMREVQDKAKLLESERRELEQWRASLKQETVKDNSRHDLQSVREELCKLRDSLYQQYRQRRDAVAAMREAVRHAAEKVQSEKRQLSDERLQLAQVSYTCQAERLKLNEQQNELAKQAQLLEEWQTQLAEDQKKQAATQVSLVAEREQLNSQTNELHADLVRLQRFKESLDKRDALLQSREQELQTREQYWSGELPRLNGLKTSLEQAQQLLAADQEKLQQQQLAQQLLQDQLQATQKQLEQEKQTLTQRLTGCADWERQLGQDRLRLDRVEEEISRQQQSLQDRIKEHESLSASWAQEKVSHEAMMQQLQAEAEAARTVLAMREEMEQQLAARESAIQETQAEQHHQHELLQFRFEKVHRLRVRLHKQRRLLREQLLNMNHSESAHESLQEQLRRRMAVLAQRESEQQQLESTWQAHMDQVQASENEWLQRKQEWENSLQTDRQLQEERRQSLDAQALQLQRDREQLFEQQQELELQKQQLAEQRQLAIQHQEQAAGQQSELEQARNAFSEMLPALLRSAEAILERMSTARTQWRTQLQEIHAYRQRCIDELSGQRDEVRQSMQQLDERFQVLSRLQDEHRLEAAALRQDCLHWQSQMEHLQKQWQWHQQELQEKSEQLAHQKQELKQNHERLEIRSAELMDKEEDVHFRRSEVNKHLSDMQGWYRDKLKDLAEKKLPATAGAEDVQLYDPPHILPLKSTRTGSDQHLADLLSGMGLIDASTLQSLMQEAQKQRITLRDCLLQNEFLSTFQMELIEAGQLEALVLGSLRIIDRLRQSAMETIYRVFDPRIGDEALLRQLSASVDANWQEEYRQLFSQAAQVQHSNVAGTFEVLSMSGSPAVLQEWLIGLPGSEWTGLINDPSVALKLIQQLASGLAALHDVGLVHGQLHLGRLLLTPAGELKICGAGEPRWLSGLASTTEPVQSDDVATAIALALPWCRGRGRSGAMAEFVKKLESKQIETAEQLKTAAYAVQRSLPGDEKAWQQLLHFVQDRLSGGEMTVMKKSA